jgi:hypothetical protein
VRGVVQWAMPTAARSGFTGRAAVLAALLAATAAGCGRYDQGTPEATLASAREMVKAGRTDRLTDLIHAESRPMRDFLDETGRLLGHLQDLSGDLRRAFPAETGSLVERARSAAEAGEPSAFMDRLLAGSRRARDRTRDRDPWEAFNGVLGELLTDPYGWLDANSQRLTVERVTDDLAALLWDGKPVLGPLIGLTLRETGGRWEVHLPLHLLGPAAPRSRDDWDMLSDLVRSFDNTVVDLGAEVRGGKFRSLDEVASRAGEMTFMPVAILMIAYGSYMQDKIGGGESPQGRPADVRGAPRPPR